MNKKQARIEALECIVTWLIMHLGNGDYVVMNATEQENEMVAIEMIKVLNLLQRKIDRQRKDSK